MPEKFQQNLFATFAFLIPTIGLFAPLAIVPVFVLLALYPSFLFFKEAKYKSFFQSNINKIILLFFIYSLCSAIWAIKPSASINLWIRMVLIFIGYLGMFSYVQTHFIDQQKVINTLLTGIILAIILANIEIFTGGIIIKNLRYYNDLYFTKPGKIKHVNDYVVELNRGSSILSIMSWACICWLFIQKKFKTAILLFITVFTTIIRLESFSTVVGFFLGGTIAFPAVYYFKDKALKLFAILAIIGVFAFAALASIIDAHTIVGKVPVVPGAASNIRIYIYDYAAKQALKKPLFGWGFNSARNYPVEKKDYVDGGRSPLPLHPHNNTLQIWLELGIAGLIIFSGFLFTAIRTINKYNDQPFALAALTGLFANYFLIGQTGYGIWQNWWVTGGIIAAWFMFLSMKKKNSKESE